MLTVGVNPALWSCIRLKIMYFCSAEINNFNVLHTCGRAKLLARGCTSVACQVIGCAGVINQVIGCGSVVH